MRKVASITGLVLVSTVMISLAAAASSGGGAKPPGTAAVTVVPEGAPFERDVRAIEDVRREWLRAVNEGRLSAVLSAYAPGAVINAAGRPPMLGAADIGAFHHRWHDDAEVFYDVDAELVYIDERLAVEEWNAQVTVSPHADALGIDGDVLQYRQGGVRVYRKDADGLWHIDRETWSADPPAVRGYADDAAHPCGRWIVC